MLQTVLLAVLIVFVGGLLLLGVIFNRKVKTEADFLVAGRSFNIYLTSFSLFATWFGAGTLMTATDQIRIDGLRSMNLEPLGAGVSLIIAGLFMAKKMWDMDIYTIADFYRVKFGKKAEKLSVASSIPSYVGWVAVQFVALANLLHSFFGWPLMHIILVVAFLSMLLTILGGLWSVTVTDSVQMFLIIGGLLVMFYNVLASHGGLPHLWENTDEHLKTLIPTENLLEGLNWLSIFLVSALGNIPGQDIVQRVFSAKNAQVAKAGCITAGLAYILIGLIPALIGIFSWQIMGTEIQSNVIGEVAKSYLSPPLTILFTVSIFATIFSTITSAILAPAALLAHNYLKHHFNSFDTVFLCRLAVVFITLLSTITALVGENFYSILEESYAIGLVCFFVPLMIGLFDSKRSDELSCLVSMSVGLVIWLIGLCWPIDFPFDLLALILGIVSYYATYFASLRFQS